MIQFLLLPGLGSDARLGHKQRSLPYNVITPDYIPAIDGEPLNMYSERFLLHLIERGFVNDREPLVLSGISMGGAIAQEMSAHIEAKAVILIGSLRHGNELRFVIREYGKHLSVHIPAWVYNAVVAVLPQVMERVSFVDRDDIELSRLMYHELPKETFREGLRMLATWEGCTVQAPQYRIHGTRDHIIPLSRTTGVDLEVAEGKHLVALSHSEIVNKAIVDFLRPLLQS